MLGSLGQVADFISKIGGVAIAIAVGVTGYYLQKSSTESQLLNQREQAETSVRAEMFKTVAERLGNTAAVCRKSYIHPHVVECFLGETLVTVDVVAKRGLKAHEAAFLSLLNTAVRVRRTSPRAREGATLH